MIFKREPALVLGAVQAILALALSFGLNLSTDQMGAILAATAAILALVTRRQVNAANVPVKPSPEEIGPGGIGPEAVVPPTPEP